MKKYNIGLGNILIAMTVLFLTAQGAKANTFTFSNPASITINDFGPATPYPATITVAGLNSPILDMNIVLNGFSHTFPNDVGVLLVGPGGQKVVLMDGAGGFTPVSNANIIFDDEAASQLPLSGGIPSGSYKPSNFLPTDVFNPPAQAAGPYASLLSIFDGTLPNGTWSLFVRDFSADDGGFISGGFGLQVTTPEPESFLLFGIGLIVVAAFLRRRLRVS